MSKISQPISQTMTARSRLLLCAAIGLTVGLVAAGLVQPRYAGLIGWDAAAICYIASIFGGILRFDAATTKSHAISENPGRIAADVILVAGSLASLAAVLLLIIQASQASGSGRLAGIGLGLASVVISWALIHTGFLLRYARLYYGSPEGGVSFNQSEPPTYGDFAYVAFTIGMAFQVSDTALQSRAFRVTALRQALLSYVFGTVIIATTINALASLA